MAAGQHDRKVIFIIQARMSSTRLPGKILLPIPLGGGKPMLKWITDALKESKYFQKIYIASSTNPLNDSLKLFCENEKISLNRGSENDVLSRFLNIISYENSFNVVVRLTGDNPIIDINKLDKTISRHLNSIADYTYTTGLPLGMNFEIINSESLRSLNHENLKDSDKEHVTLFIKNNNHYAKQQVSFSNEFNIRATIDYPSDFVFVSTYLEYVLYNSIKVSSDSLQSFVQSYPWVLDINKQNFQKKTLHTMEDEIEEALTILEILEFNKLYTFLKSLDLNLFKK
ncbi:MAG: spore coat polysaccharide biosynthesis protein SpsF [Psychroserpens sp.]|jgi:spore coat polysaccharide biosynthesis protein SpsF